MPAPTTSMSPAELAQLEHAFATDPNSEAYRALAEAYLGMGRFMEAMVVCKKGVKAHPDRADPRVLLARVYAEQGKDRKALEELEGAIQAAPKDVPALRMAAGLLLKVGDNDKGKDYLLRAYKAAPADAETQELLAKWKIEAPVEAAPPPAMVTAAEVALGNGSAPTPQPMAAVPQGYAPQPLVQTGATTIPQSVAFPQNGSSGGTQPYAVAQTGATTIPQGVPPGYQAPAPQRSQSGQRPAMPRPRNTAPARPQIDLSQFEEPDEPVRHGGSHGGFITLGFAALALVALVGYYFYSQHVKAQKLALSSYLSEAREQLDHDSYASYKKACELAQDALKIDIDSPAAQADLAYAWTIRWGEHGEGETARSQAQEHLKIAEKLNPNAQHVIAAQALFEFFSANAPQAESELAKKVEDLEAKNQASDLVYQTLGIIEMRNGDLEKAGTHLKKALDLAGGVPRTHAAIGDLYRRQGQELLAWTYYDNALRYEKDHADAVLGKTLLVLEAQNPNYKIAEDLIKRVRDADPPPSPRQLAMAYMLDGMRLNQIGQKAEGLSQEQKALALDNSNPEIHVLVGRRELKDGDAQKGLKEIQEAIRLDPKRASFYVELARAQLALPNGAKDAINSLQTALKTLPGSAKLLQMLGDAYLRSGDATRAQETYEKALAVDPKAQLPDVQLALAEMARRSRNFGKAGELYEKAAQQYGTNTAKVAESYTDEALLLEEQNAPKDKVFEMLKKANGADQNYAPAYYQLARFLSSDRKQKGMVKQLAAQYLKLEPKGPYAAEAQRLAK